MQFNRASSGLWVPDRRIRPPSIIDPRYCPPLPDVGWMPPMRCAVASEDTGSNSTGNGFSLTVSDCTVTSGNCLVVMMGLGTSSGTDITTALTVNGSSIFANVLWNRSDSNWVRTKLFYMLNPPTGALTIVGTLSGAAQFCMLAASLTGVDVSGTPFGTAAVNSGSGTTASVAVTSSSGFVIGGISSDSESGITEGGTLLVEVQNVGADTSFGLQYYTTTNPTVSWTQANTGWACAGCGVNASGGGGGGNPWYYYQNQYLTGGHA